MNAKFYTDMLELRCDDIYQANKPGSQSLMKGELGLFVAILSIKNGQSNEVICDSAGRIILHIFEKINNQTSDLEPASFGYGFTGLAFVLNKFMADKRVKDYIDTSLLTKMDDHILSLVPAQLKAHNYGFMNGAAGSLYYILGRMKHRPELKKDINEILVAFRHAAVIDREGLRFKPGKLHADWTIEGFSNHYNLSLSDGLVGILLVFIQARKLLNDNTVVQKMIIEGMKFILMQERPVSETEQQFCFFPTIVSDLKAVRDLKKEFYGSRLGWCIGDLPVALLLCEAGKFFENKDWIEKGCLVGEFTLKRKNGVSSKVDNAAFCHGAAGITAIYKCLYELTGNELFKIEGYNFWLDKLVNDLETNVRSVDLDLLDGDLGKLLVLADACKKLNNNVLDIFLL